jgi:hypothetical protein
VLKLIDEEEIESLRAQLDVIMEEIELRRVLLGVRMEGTDSGGGRGALGGVGRRERRSGRQLLGRRDCVTRHALLECM